MLPGMVQRLVVLSFLCVPLACGGSTIAEDSPGSGGAGTGGAASGGSGGVAPAPCDLKQVASGVLPASGTSPTSLTGPAVVATPNGFVLAYRRWDGSSLRLVMHTLSASGTLGSPKPFELIGCPLTGLEDGVSLAFSGNFGLATTSLPNCGSGAGAAFIPFDADAVAGDAVGPKNATFKSLSLWRSALAPASAPDEWEFFYRVESTDEPLQRIVLEDSQFKNAPLATPFDKEDASFVGMASSPEVRAYAAAQPAGVVMKLAANTGDDVSIESELQLPAAQSFAITAWSTSVAVALPQPTGVYLASARRQGGWTPTATFTIPNSPDPQTTDSGHHRRPLARAPHAPGQLLRVQRSRGRKQSGHQHRRLRQALRELRRQAGGDGRRRQPRGCRVAVEPGARPGRAARRLGAARLHGLIQRGSSNSLPSYTAPTTTTFPLVAATDEPDSGLPSFR